MFDLIHASDDHRNQARLARRLLAITHEQYCGSQFSPFLVLTYSYTPDGLISQIGEEPDPLPCINQVFQTSTISYTYDNRNRLIAESRSGPNAYSFTYAYDQGGNRTRKDIGATGHVEYFYDVDPASSYNSRANRLMRYTVFSGSTETLDVTYEYDTQGNPSRIISRGPLVAGSSVCSATRFYYDTALRVWLTLDETWSEDGAGNQTNCARTACREFRYESGRSRYLVRSRNPNTLAPNDDAQWSDYDADSINLDYHVNRASGAITDDRRYLAGIAQQDAATGANSFFHGDQIGSMRAMTNDASSPTRQVVYTAFGEPVYSSGTPESRYGYAGAFGYESFNDSAIHYVHVGERWYDPAAGRFLQRDPIGIEDGTNVYDYAWSEPVSGVDALGLDRWHVDTGILGHHYLIVDNHKGLFKGVPYLRIDFYGINGTGRVFDNGRVAIVPWKDPPPPGSQRIPSTKDEDAALLKEADADASSPPGYNIILYNCQHYSRKLSRAGTNPARWIDIKH